MKSLLLLALPLGAAAPLLTSPSAPAQSDQDMAEMMAKAAKYTQPGANHEPLARLIGEWEVDAAMSMGGQTMPQGKGSATVSWKVEGRWLEGTYRGAIMGMKGTHHMWLGYDNMKMSYVYTDISSWDTAMKHAEGDLTQDGKTLIMYGTLDEYLTGEHDKMVKYVWRFHSDDKMVLEVHDLAIGEKNTKVLEFTYTRKS